MPGNKRRGGNGGGKRDNRSNQRRENPRRERHAGGFDPTTGLPAFLVQAPNRQEAQDRHSQA
jgi:hypothetical protein